MQVCLTCIYHLTWVFSACVCQVAKLLVPACYEKCTSSGFTNPASLILYPSCSHSITFAPHHICTPSHLHLMQFYRSTIHQFHTMYLQPTHIPYRRATCLQPWIPHDTMSWFYKVHICIIPSIQV